MSFPSHRNCGRPHLSNQSLHRSSSNLSRLSTIPTASLKSQLLTLLIKTFEHRVIDTHKFLPMVDTGYIRRSVACYERHVESCVAVMSRVCCCCGLFVSSLSSVVVLRSDPMVVVALDEDAINMAFLDHYGREIDEYQFCYLCFNILKQKKVPKFSSVNKINVVMCQDYLPALEVLTLVEEMLIAQCHPVMSILKLRPNGALLLVAYQYVCGHAVVFLQSPRLLSTILPLFVVKLHEHIRVVWFIASKPNTSQVKSFISVRRVVVFHALLWLGANNILYKDVIINHEKMAN